VPALGKRPARRPIGLLLLEAGACTAEALAEALSAQQLEDERVGETLVRLKHCDEWAVTQALAKQSALPCVASVSPDQIADDLVQRLPIGFARASAVIPHRLDAVRGALLVFAADPRRLMDLDDLGQLDGAELNVTLMPPGIVAELINAIYAKRAKDVDLEKKDEAFDEEDEDILHASAEDAPIIR